MLTRLSAALKGREKMIKHMIDMVMDDIRDTEMIVEYAKEAKARGEKPEVVNWFAVHAKERLNGLERDWRDVESEMRAHDREGEISDALACHVEHTIHRIKIKAGKL